MGKTEKGAIWLNKELFSSYDYWQFWRNTDDRDVKNFLNFFTEIETKKINKLLQDNTNINKLKIILANETTKILHGKDAAIKAEKTAKETFETGGAGKELPEIKLKAEDLKKGINILNLLSSTKILSSKSEVRRAIKNLAIKIDNKTVTDDKKIITLNDFNKEKSLKVSFGKKKHFLLKII